MGAELSTDQGVVTVSTGSPSQPSETQHARTKEQTELLEHLEALKQHIPPEQTPQQLVAQEAATVAAVQQAGGACSEELCKLFTTYQDWSNSRRKPLLQEQARLQVKIGQVATLAQSSMLSVKRAAASIAAADTALAGATELSQSICDLVNQVQDLQRQLHAAQRDWAQQQQMQQGRKEGSITMGTPPGPLA